MRERRCVVVCVFFDLDTLHVLKEREDNDKIKVPSFNTVT